MLQIFMHLWQIWRRKIARNENNMEKYIKY